MLVSQYVLVGQMVGRQALPERDRDMILRHFEATRRPDGSWPLHCEAPGSLFVTVLAYVALRVLGVPPEAPLAMAARRWLRTQDDSVTILPTWGRMWLAMLGLYEYEGINPLCPETVLLPAWVPVHPDRLYVHTRLIYAALSYLYARRARFDLGPLAGPLRQELYGQPYGSIDFAACRKRLAAADIYRPPPRLLRVAADILARYERHPVQGLRKLAAPALPPGSKPSWRHQRGRECRLSARCSDALSWPAPARRTRMCCRRLARLDAWRWEDEDRRSPHRRRPLRVVGHRLRHARHCCARPPRRRSRPRSAADTGGWQQPRRPANCRPGCAGAVTACSGGWSFSDGTHRWPVSDCTAEALSAVLTAHRRADLQPSSARSAA